ncbi:MAG TPA: TRAP transporter TatT component family protein [Candidatus Paceibacterota bacterium]|nr:TRAP transporter TatT component family protein [Verrucomicrobiota bacterium]HRZ44307.1 TRAP transporter TatT component family protein [Candidatus Paceibacterota bacterium]HRZ92252.1 TRAP transporter TatT component family protein [Candidatus Paceibacterota bacterium]
MNAWSRVAVLMAGLLVAMPGCSVRRMAVNRVGDALAAGGTAFRSDDDPELIRAAAPFSLKLMESLLEEAPRHEGLLLAAASGFTQYGFAFVQQEADELEDRDLDAAVAMRERARRLYVRARGYALRGLEARHPGFGEALRRRPREAAGMAEARDVPLLYWAAASWGAAISLGKDRPDEVADLPLVEALADRALELDEDYDRGAIHGFLITFETIRQGAEGDSAARSQRHFERAMELGGGMEAGPLVALAEAVAQPAQQKGQFEALLKQALAIDPDRRPESRLANLIHQRRARWLLGRMDRLFLE